MNSPCKKCLVRAACVARLFKYLHEDIERYPTTESSIHRAYSFVLRKRCKLIIHYIHSRCDGDDIMETYDAMTRVLDEEFNIFERMNN